MNSNLVRAFWNFNRKVLNYSKNCSLHNTLIPNLVKPLMYYVVVLSIYLLLSIGKVEYICVCCETKSFLRISEGLHSLYCAWALKPNLTEYNALQRCILIRFRPMIIHLPFLFNLFASGSQYQTKIMSKLIQHLVLIAMNR